MAGELQLHQDAVAEISARLSLRAPNQLAIETLDAELSQHFDVEAGQLPFEVIVDVATGVGKTYILAGAMELMVEAYDITNFVIIAPGSTILKKTKDNFTQNHPKSLLGPMSFDPLVITAENFSSPAVAAAIDDPNLVKIYLFTVQSLLRPTAKQNRKVHQFQEGLGAQFYSHLQAIDQLVVFADEHHAYFAVAFSKAVSELNPWLLLGLTATPDKRTPKEQIIYRYPLAAAIADKLVKTPVIVGRKDDRSDPLTKLIDGVTLLRAKNQAVKAYTNANGLKVVNPVMLVVAKTIDDADQYGDILRSGEFFGGAYAEAVLVVHSSAPDEALEALAAVEDVDSPVRIIISVGMLKEGWDVKNVYVIASMRSSVSEILTEQTLGRGMRLPFGHYTDLEILDTLEVVAHERYEELLKKAGVLNEAFVDYRTRAVLRLNAQGQQVVVSESTSTAVEPIITDSADPVVTTGVDESAAPVVTTITDRSTQIDETVLKLKQVILRREDAPALVIPLLRMSAVESSFSLADITDTDPFRKLGASLAANPAGELSRTLLSARVVTGRDGIRHTELVTTTGADRVRSAPTLLPEADLRIQLAEIVLGSPAVPARKNQRTALQPLLDAFLEGLGKEMVSLLSANLDRAGARLIRLVESEQRKYMANPSYKEVVDSAAFEPIRITDKQVSTDRLGAFSKAMAYGDWKRSIYSLAWFDSKPERTVANMVDEDDSVAWWLRLHINDLPILWSSGGQNYNPDLLVIETDGTHWVVEAKMEKEMKSGEVQTKRVAARRWANYVTADENVEFAWKYLLVSESDIDTSKGSWAALKKLGS